ncbi:MAG: GlsB/YeaQ/YmgE family stress response membrane protein [Candidatus Limnocylindrales bacterium]
MDIISWIIVGLIAGVLASFLVGGGVGLLGAIVLGIIGAIVGGFLARVVGIGDPTPGELSIASIVTATIGAIIVILVYRAIAGRRAI